MGKETIRLTSIGETGPSASAIGLSDDIDIARLFGALWRGKWILTATVIVLTGVAALYVSQLPPRYVAETLIAIEGRGPQFVKFDSVVSELSIDTMTIETEIEVLGSRKLAEKVVEKLQLDDSPEFNPGLRAEEDTPEETPFGAPSGSGWLA